MILFGELHSNWDVKSGILGESIQGVLRTSMFIEAYREGTAL